jgi:hypothetical protein
MYWSSSEISLTTTIRITHATTPPNNAQSSSNEGDILLAIQAIELRQIHSIRQATAQYNVPYLTLRQRMNGMKAKSDTIPRTQRLTPAEEDILIQKVLQLDSHGLPVRLDNLRDFASAITQVRGQPCVGSEWAHNFVQRTLELKTRMIRSMNYRRVLREDPK